MPKRSSLYSLFSSWWWGWNCSCVGMSIMIHITTITTTITTTTTAATSATTITTTEFCQLTARETYKRHDVHLYFVVFSAFLQYICLALRPISNRQSHSHYGLSLGRMTQYLTDQVISAYYKTRKISHNASWKQPQRRVLPLHLCVKLRVSWTPIVGNPIFFHPTGYHCCYYVAITYYHEVYDNSY